MTDRPVIVPDELFWNPRQARYQDARGRIVSRDTVLSLVGERIEGGIDTTLDYLAAVTRGGAPVDAWQTAMETELKRSFLQNYAAGKGGWEALTQADYGRMGARLREQYKYLRNFAQELASGTLTEREIQRRMAMYERAARTAFYDGSRSAAKVAGKTKKRRILNPAEHCEECVGYAERGEVPIDDPMPPPGIGSSCLSNCACDEIYS